MSPNVIQLISSQCVQGSLQSVGLSQWLALIAIHLHVGSNRHLYLQSSVQLIFVNKATLDDGCLQGFFLLTELPWNLLAVLGILAAAGTSSRAHRSAMSVTLINNIDHEWRSGSQNDLTVGRQPNPCRMEPLLWRKVSTTQPQAPIQMKG